MWGPPLMDVGAESFAEANGYGSVCQAMLKSYPRFGLSRYKLKRKR